MKKFLILCLVLLFVLPLGCGKKEEQKEEQKEVEEAVEEELPRSDVKVVMIDPVSNEMIGADEKPYTYVYQGKAYFFKTEENKEIFKKDPEKYIKKE